jgi:hypothetical protein
MDNDFINWARLNDVWSERDLIDLCCGLIPGEARPSNTETNNAQQAITAAKLARTLTPICKEGATAGDHIYRTAQYFRPTEAALWAMQKFDKFPQALAEAAKEGLQIGGGHSEDKPLTSRAETTYLNIIGGLLALMLGKSLAGTRQSIFNNQTAIIDALLAHYPDKPGIAQRTLEGKFAAANSSLTRT